MTGELCVSLSRIGAADLALAGGKGANLGELLGAGFRVPPGFVVTTESYRRAVGADPQTLDTVRAVAVPDEVTRAIAEHYAALGGGPVAVRSSATAEDLPGATFAGQQDSYLGVIGEQSLVAAVRDCWASLWTERAIDYRGQLGVEAGSVAIAVVVQRMVDADQAGVMFTADPVTGARDRIVIDSNPGLGEAVVSGLVTPDHFVLDAADRVIEHRPGRREVIIRSRHDGGTEQVHDAGSTAPEHPDVAQLAGIGRRIAEHFGRPQDIEWATAGEAIWILQSRPMTALPPPPVRLNRVQLLTGPVILELLPRRPYPMELTAWTRTVGGHLEGLIDGLAGAHVDIDDVLIADDAVLTSYLPFAPRPTLRTPRRLLRSLLRMGRDPRDWRIDKRFRRYLDGAAALAAMDLDTASWQELTAVPDRAARLLQLVTDLRVGYLPAAAGAMVRLRLLLTLLGRTELFAALLLELPTETDRANTELAAIADDLRSVPGLVETVADTDPAEAPRLLSSTTDAEPARRRLQDFLTRYGHRETGSILLLRDPCWADDPATVMTLVQVLLHDAAGAAESPFPAALQRLLGHRIVRALHAESRVRALVTKASAGVQVREDTHFELTRTMPSVRRAVIEAGRRLAAAGALDVLTDVWYLSLDELTSLPDPQDHPVGDRLRSSVERRRAAFAELARSPLIATATLYPRRVDADALATGVGGGGGTATGPVRVIRGPAEFGELQPGDVLVCPATNPSWTPLFGRAAAVVVDHGGLASHAAIVAREYGIPAVMGTGDGSSVLATGVRVTVDGDRGRVLRAPA